MRTEQRFWSKIDLDFETGCWNWKYGLDKDGYGQFSIGKSKIKPHRYIFKLIKGEIQNGLVIDHLCRNRKCVNPNHMETVSQKFNILRGISFSSKNKNKTECNKGHTLSGENLRLWIDKKGRTHRICITCTLINHKTERKI